MSTSAIRNVMSVDVEDYFQVAAFENIVAVEDWDSYSLRVDANTHRFLDLFAKHQVKTTFFTLGWVAKRCPELVKRIVDEGHELASHGTMHQRASQQSYQVFKQDVDDAKKLLEDIAGVQIKGYRAPSYSITPRIPWAIDALVECGYQYSSSVYPVKHDLYGIPNAPRQPFLHSKTQLLEVPISTDKVLGRTLPAGGGGFFRLLPLSVSKALIKRVNQRQLPVIFYLHPWEIDTQQPRFDNASLKSRFRHYLNLDKTYSRLDHLLEHFDWGRLDHYIGTLDKKDLPNYDIAA